MTSSKIVGLVPAAGKGTRLSLLPFSKELIPIGFSKGQKPYPKTVSSYLIDRFRDSGVTKVIYITSPYKTDIIQYFGSGRQFGVDISFLTIEESKGMPYTIHRSLDWISDSMVCFGMPDTIFGPRPIFKKLIQASENFDADVVLGLYKTTTPWKFGMVNFDNSGQATYIVDKPRQTELEYMWGNAVWNHKFSFFMRQILETDIFVKSTSEVVFGDILQLAIKNNLRVFCLPFENEPYFDVGTPDGFNAAQDFVNNTSEFL